MNFLKKVKLTHKLHTFIEKVEELPLPVYIFPILGIGWGVLRMFLESKFLSFNGISFYMYLHGIATFTFTFLYGTFFLSLFSGQKLERVIKITSIGYILLIVPPIIDGIFFHRAMIYKYVDPFRPDLPSCNLFSFLFSFEKGFCAGPGIRLELWLIFALVLLYSFLKRSSLSSSLLKNLSLSFLAGFSVIGLFVFVLYQEYISIKILPGFMMKIIRDPAFRRIKGFELFTVYQYETYSLLIVLYLIKKSIKDKLLPVFTLSLILFLPVLWLLSGKSFYEPNFLFLLLSGISIASIFLVSGAIFHFYKTPLLQINITLLFLIFLLLILAFALSPFVWLILFICFSLSFTFEYLKINSVYNFVTLLFFEIMTFTIFLFTNSQI